MANGMGSLPTTATVDAPPVRPITTLAPRPKPPVSVFTPDPEQTARWRKLAAVVANSDRPNRGAIDESYDRFRHHADRAFGDEA